MVFEKPADLGATLETPRLKSKLRPLSLHTSSEFYLKLSVFENKSHDQFPKFGDAPTTDPTKPRQLLNGKVGKLVTSLSNPSLLKVDATREEHLEKEKLDQSQSQIIEPLAAFDEDNTSCTVMPEKNEKHVDDTQASQEAPVDESTENAHVVDMPEKPSEEGPIDDTQANEEGPIGDMQANEEGRIDDIQANEEGPIDDADKEGPQDTPTNHPIKVFKKRGRKVKSKTIVPIGPIARNNFRDSRPMLQEVDNNNFLSLNFFPGRVSIKHDGLLGAPSLSMQFSPYSPNTPSLYKPLTPREDDDDDESVVEEDLDDHELRTHGNVALLHSPIPIMVWTADDSAEVVVEEISEEDNSVTIPITVEIEDCSIPTAAFILPEISSDEDPFLGFELNNSRTTSKGMKQRRQGLTCSTLATNSDSLNDTLLISHNFPDGSDNFFNKHDGSQNDLNSSTFLTEGTRKYQSAPTSLEPSPSTCASPSSPVPVEPKDSLNESHPTMSEDDASLLTSSSFEPSEGTIASSQRGQLTPSPTFSTNTESSCLTVKTIKSGSKRDHNKLRIDTSRFTNGHKSQLVVVAPPLPPLPQGNNQEEDENVSETVISSKVSRKGALFAKKVKSIANFQYNNGKKLGKGNFGIVYNGKKISPKASQKQEPNQQQLTLKDSVPEGTEVAIKKITRKLPGEIEKLGLVQREMRVCRLFHDKVGIIPLLDIITTNKHHYLVFEKADGDLAEKIKERSTRAAALAKAALGKEYQLQLQLASPSGALGNIFSIDEIRIIMRTVIHGVQVLHKNGYSHKDIKPANILHKNGEGLLCDFGLCSRGDDLPRNQFFGTQEYASPEARRVMAHRSCDYIQSDIYSLGAVLYELATGSVLCKVISHGLNWQKIALFGGRHFCEMLQGMLNDLEKRWTIEQVCKSPFWSDMPSSEEVELVPPPPLERVIVRGKGMAVAREVAPVQ
ncbi:hypothetical protein BGZ52_001254 [Haplosporangium bisporale]|nr:hypothetical protein BGZ52_001254 [Haplosporangium bisporale]